MANKGPNPKIGITMREKYGEDYYKRIGAIGGRKGTTGGFAYPLLCDCNYKEELHKKAECAGAIGGRKSKRQKRGNDVKNQIKKDVTTA